MTRRNCTFSSTHRKILLFSSNKCLVSLSKFSKYFGFNSNLCCYLFSSSSSLFPKKHWYALYVHTDFSHQQVVRQMFWANQLALFLVSWVGLTSCSQPFSNVYRALSSHRKDFALVHQIDSKIRCCSRYCCPGRRTKCCGCSRISAEPIYHSLILELYAGLVHHRVRLTKNPVEIISLSDASKDWGL